MKKILSVLLSACLLVGTVLPVAASGDNSDAPKSDSSNYPFVLVRGMDFDGLKLNVGSENETNCLGSFSLGSALKCVVNGLKSDFSLDGLTDGVLDYADEMLGTMACTKDGNSLYDVQVPTYTESLANYPDFFEKFNNSFTKEIGIVKEAVDRYGAENVYYFYYDWRLDPLDTAEDLNSLIETAKADHNADKVNLVSCSMGGIVADSYIYKYGSDSLNKCVFDSTTFCGTYVTSELFQGKVEIDSGTLYRYLNKTAPKYSVLLNIANKLGAFKLLSKIAMKFVAKEKDKIYDEFLREKFGTMPILWGLVQPSEYDKCIDYMFPTQELKNEYSGLIERTQNLNEMMSGMDELLLSLSEKGVNVAVVASYDLPLAPVYPSAKTQGDVDLESALMLGRATVSNLGETLGDDYVPVNEEKLSPDRCIDLSEVLFPDYTWAVKGSPHVAASYGTEFSDFLFWIVDYDGQPTVYSNPDYPQFMVSGSDEHLEKF